MRLAAARIFVDSLDWAIEHYRLLLGAPVAADVDAGFAVFAAGDVQVVIEHVAVDAPAEDRVLVGRFTGVSFAVDDIAGEFDRLQAAGVRFTAEPERQSWGGTLAGVVDPSGNEVQLVQYPATPWRNTKHLTDLDPPQAVEQLIFEVKPEAFERWRAADFELWTVAEADQFPGFVSKEVWVQPGEMYTVAIIIHWTSLEEWKSVDMSWVEAQEARFSALVGADNYRLIRAPHELGEQFYKISDYR